MKKILTMVLICIMLTGCANINPGLPVNSIQQESTRDSDSVPSEEPGPVIIEETPEPLTIDEAFEELGISYSEMWPETMMAKLSGNTTMTVLPEIDGLAGMSIVYMPNESTQDSMAIYKVDEELFYCRNDVFYKVLEPDMTELNEQYFGGRTIQQFVEGWGTDVYLNKDEKQITISGSDSSIVVTGRNEAVYVKLQQGDISISYEFSNMTYDPQMIRDSLKAETQDCEEMTWADFYVDFNTYMNEHTRFNVDADGTVHAPGCGCGDGESTGTCTAGCC